MAFQALLPKASTFWVTFLAGSVATLAGLFPAFAMKLLDFVSLYGFVLAPVGAIIVFEHFFHKKFGIIQYYAEKRGLTFNSTVLLAWVFSAGGFYFWSQGQEIFLSFMILPAWICCGLLYLVLSKHMQKSLR